MNLKSLTLACEIAFIATVIYKTKRTQPRRSGRGDRMPPEAQAGVANIDAELALPDVREDLLNPGEQLRAGGLETAFGGVGSRTVSVDEGLSPSASPSQDVSETVKPGLPDFTRGA